MTGICIIRAFEKISEMGLASIIPCKFSNKQRIRKKCNLPKCMQIRTQKGPYQEVTRKWK